LNQICRLKKPGAQPRIKRQCHIKTTLWLVRYSKHCNQLTIRRIKCWRHTVLCTKRFCSQNARRHVTFWGTQLGTVQWCSSCSCSYCQFLLWKVANFAMSWNQITLWISLKLAWLLVWNLVHIFFSHISRS
jgi:hypothetical protein